MCPTFSCSGFQELHGSKDPLFLQELNDQEVPVKHN